MGNKLFFLLLLVLTFGCAKEDKNYSYWNDLATAEWSKIQELTKGYSCQDMDKLTLQTIEDICPFNWIVHSKDLNRFQELNKQYQKYRTKALHAKDAPYSTALVDCLSNMALKIDCKDNKPAIITVMDLDLPELNSQISELQEEIKHFYDDVPCTQSNDWIGSYHLASDCKLEGVAIHKTIKTKEFGRLLNLINMCVFRKNTLEGINCNYKFPNSVTVTCQQNKPKVDLP